MQSIKFFKKLTLLLILNLSLVFAQDNLPLSRHQFENVIELKTTPVKNQGRSGTCWAFATTSFVETELIRMGKGEFDLSEMYSVNHKLKDMGHRFIRFHGTSNFGQGGQAHDIINQIANFGFVPEQVYSGKVLGKDYHDHGEFDTVLQGMLEAIKKRRTLTSKWEEAYSRVIDTYLGDLPTTFEYEGKNYTPKSFAESTGFNPDDYIELTSYIHHPFYSKFVLEVPDNWKDASYYNLPIDELMEVINHALETGYSVDWDGDSGKDNFKRVECYGVIPTDDPQDPDLPEKEKFITQEMRQTAFDNYDVTDDHLMHITGTAKDQTGKKFFLTKNSWGTKNRLYDGFWYLSEQYLRLKTVAIMVHKDALPENIKSKLGL